jgi:hypothetical protein
MILDLGEMGATGRLPRAWPISRDVVKHDRWV